MSAATIALLAEVIDGQERIMKQLNALEAHVDWKLEEERTRVETIARLLDAAPEPKGLTVVPGDKT